MCCWYPQQPLDLWGLSMSLCDTDSHLLKCTALTDSHVLPSVVTDWCWRGFLSAKFLLMLVPIESAFTNINSPQLVALPAHTLWHIHVKMGFLKIRSIVPNRWLKSSIFCVMKLYCVCICLFLTEFSTLSSWKNWFPCNKTRVLMNKKHLQD